MCINWRLRAEDHGKGNGCPADIPKRFEVQDGQRKNADRVSKMIGGLGLYQVE